MPRPPIRQDAADERLRLLLPRVVGELHPRRLARSKLHEARRLIVEDDLKLMDLVETLQAGNELLLGGGERRAFHTAGAVEDVDESAPFTLHAKDLRTGLSAATLADGQPFSRKREGPRAGGELTGERRRFPKAGSGGELGAGRFRLLGRIGKR